tara:strand:+ start:379 stop:609 length:231 start_codon:yes stop_codon:yes gene_type:complete
MSLLKELKPEIAAKIEADREQFPNLHRGIVRDIENAALVTDLPLGTAHRLIEYANAAGFKFTSTAFLLKVYEVFNR